MPSLIPKIIFTNMHSKQQNYYQNKTSTMLTLQEDLNTT